MALIAPNATTGNPNPDELIPIILFPNQGAGFGFGETKRGAGGELPEGYHSTINMTCRNGDRLTPSFAIGDTLGTGANNAGGFLMAWQTAAGVPFVISSVGGAVNILTNGALANEADATSDFYSGACFGDNGSTTAYLLAGTTAGSLNYRTQAGSWTQSATVTAYGIVNTGAHYWAKTAANQVKNCLIGTDPTTAGNWLGTAITVCSRSLTIRSLGGISGKLVCGVDDGLYTYIEADNRFENIYPVSFNPGHFPFMAGDGMGGLYTATSGGEIVWIQRFGGIVTVGPLRQKTPDRDVPHGPIVDMAVYGQSVYALMDRGYRTTQNVGLKVLKTVDNFVSFTDYSTNATDLNFSTTADISLLDTLANGDALLVGCDEMVLGLDLIMLATNSTGSRTLRVDWSTGADAWTADSVLGFDGTSVGGGTMAQSGMVTLSLATGDPSAHATPWVKATYNSLTKYWLRLTVSGTLDGSTTIAEIRAVPRRGAPAFGRTATPGVDVFEAAGLLPKVLRGRRVGDNLIWDDVFTLPVAEPARKLCVSTLPTATSPNGSLIVTTGNNLYQIPLPYFDEPSLADYPKLARDADISGTFRPSAWDGGGQTYECRYLEVFGENLVEGTDSLAASIRWNDTNAWTVPTVQASNYALFPFESYSNFGEVLHAQIKLVDSATTEPVSPNIRQVVAWVKQVQHPDAAQPARMVPEAT